MHLVLNNPYLRPPKVVNPALGSAANTAGGGRNPQFDNISPAPQEQKLDQINSEHPTFYSNKKKKKSADQCELDENSKVKKKYK